MDTTADVTGDDVMDEISALLERDVAEMPLLSLRMMSRLKMMTTTSFDLYG